MHEVLLSIVTRHKHSLSLSISLLSLLSISLVVIGCSIVQVTCESGPLDQSGPLARLDSVDDSAAIPLSNGTSSNGMLFALARPILPAIGGVEPLN